MKLCNFMTETRQAFGGYVAVSICQVHMCEGVSSNGMCYEGRLQELSERVEALEAILQRLEIPATVSTRQSPARGGLVNDKQGFEDKAAVNCPSCGSTNTYWWKPTPRRPVEWICRACGSRW